MERPTSDLSLGIALLFGLPVEAMIQNAHNDAQYNAQYTVVTTTVAAASDQDTPLVHGSAEACKYVTISIPLAIIGPGHGPANGQLKYTGAGNDRDPFLQNIGGVVPTNIRQEQLQ